MPVAVSCNKAVLTSLIILTIIGLAVIVGPTCPSTRSMTRTGGHAECPGHGDRPLVRHRQPGATCSCVPCSADASPDGRHHGALVAVIIGTLYGAASGFIGGRVDSLMMRVLEILNAFPFMFFVIMLVTFFGRNLALIFLAIGAVSWLDMARIVRPDPESQEQGVHRGGPRLRRLQVEDHHPSHQPNVLGIVAVYASLLVPGMIMFESS